MYAILETGGKQYKVAPGQIVEVERLPLEEDATVEMGRVLLVADGDKVTVGKPVIEGAKVVATVLGEAKGDKVTVFKYKPKVHYRKKTGHRQIYTKLAIKDIVLGQEAGDGP
ncbi:MAG: 50S ribosomal protein L21 [Chloroflexi bacterium]|nr:50S ribosomal protein L21 [Chloroflexota bacterium]